MAPASPNRTPIKKDAPFLETSFHYLSQFLVNRPPTQVSQWDPYEEKHPCTEHSTSHPLKIHLSLRVPGKRAPSIFPNRVPMERDTPTPEPLVYLFVYICQSPQKMEPSYKMGKNIRSPSTEPHAGRRPTHSGARPGSPRGLLMTILSPTQCHAALGMIPSALAWVDQSPISQAVS